MDDPLSSRTLRRMVDCIDPEWTLREAVPVESGFSAVYRLSLAGGGPSECYLKAAIDGQGAGIPADARILSLLEARTELPVPTVLGAVDEHPDLPAPCHLTAPISGVEHRYEAVGWVTDAFLRRLASQFGRYLGALHAVEAVDSFGYVDSAGQTLSGGRPAGSPAELTVVRGAEDWPPYLRQRVEAGLEEHGDTRFSGLTERLREWFDGRIEALSGPFAPALCRNDHGLHNVLVSPDGAVTGLPDWAYTLATPPAYDVAFAVFIYGGAYLAGMDGLRDRRGLVHRALAEGYRSAAPGLAARALDPPPVYEMAAALRLMNHFERLRLPPGETDSAAAGLRRWVRGTLDTSA